MENNIKEPTRLGLTIVHTKMGQTLSKTTPVTPVTHATPDTSSLLVTHAIADADIAPLGNQPATYTCKLSSTKHAQPLTLTTQQSQSAHGTRFIYFHTSKPIVLADYNHIVCSRTEDEIDTPSTMFHTATLHYDTKIVHKGTDYHQFASPISTDQTPRSRLLVRTKAKSPALSTNTSDTTLQQQLEMGRRYKGVGGVGGSISGSGGGGGGAGCAGLDVSGLMDGKVAWGVVWEVCVVG